MDKPTHVKPGLYAMYYEYMKEIAKQYGYNLVIHGSLHRDLDLVAIPWVDNPRDEQIMIAEFESYLTGKSERKPDNTIPFSILPGGRHCYTIQLNRGNKHGEWVRFEDKQYYLDISVTPYIGKNTNPIPQDAHSLEVFAIKESDYSATGKEAYIGYKLKNGDFHYISVPFTEPNKHD